MIRVLAILLAFAAAPAWAQEPIKIGLVTALSGQSARAGEAITRGLQVAIDDLHVFLDPQPFQAREVDVGCAGTTGHAVNFVALGQKKLGEIGAILAGDASDQSFAGHFMLLVGQAASSA